MDTMAHEDGRNAADERRFSKHKQPFSEERDSEVVWWAPPNHLLRDAGMFVMRKAKQGRAGKPVLLTTAEEWALEAYVGRMEGGAEVPPGNRVAAPSAGTSAAKGG